MARIHRLSTYFTFVLTLYAMLYFRIIETEWLPHDRVVLLPIWIISMLGFYVILDLVTGVLGIETADSAAEELKQDIAAAKADLASKGLKVE